MGLADDLALVLDISPPPDECPAFLDRLEKITWWLLQSKKTPWCYPVTPTSKGLNQDDGTGGVDIDAKSAAKFTSELERYAMPGLSFTLRAKYAPLLQSGLGTAALATQWSPGRMAFTHVDHLQG